MVPRTLLIIAHGSNSAAWTHAIESLCENIQTHFDPSTEIHETTLCYLEHSQPDISTVLQHFTQSSQQEIIALPLFLSVGQHVTNDIPKELSNISTLESYHDGISIYRCNETVVRLLDPPSLTLVLTENLSKRFRCISKDHENTGLLIVYYGAKKFLESWSHLAFAVQSSLINDLPNVPVEWIYAGEAVDFSPEPLTERLIALSQRCERIAVLPALVSVGIIQNEIIPEAIANSALGKRILYQGDSILPDSFLEKRIADFVRQKLEQMKKRGK